jgi:lipoyl(octanoyl) transferase
LVTGPPPPSGADPAAPRTIALGPAAVLGVYDLGSVGYQDGLALQHAAHARVLASRESGSSLAGELLLLEHTPVITLSRRPGAGEHLLASADLLATMGVALEPTDRGGDITYHGPGQLVAYPILDLNRFGLRLHDYMRLLEQCVIDTCAQLGLATGREPGATGVWTVPSPSRPAAKVCAMGVRVARWISTHGLAINVTTNLRHFDLIVPCGLAGRAVTSLSQELGPDACPPLERVASMLTAHLAAALRARLDAQATTRAPDGAASHGGSPPAASG